VPLPKLPFTQTHRCPKVKSDIADSEITGDTYHKYTRSPQALMASLDHMGVMQIRCLNSNTSRLVIEGDLCRLLSAFRVLWTCLSVFINPRDDVCVYVCRKRKILYRRDPRFLQSSHLAPSPPPLPSACTGGLYLLYREKKELERGK
jgi:hypothetical protein